MQEGGTTGIRPMLPIDLSEVMEIENRSYDFPWSEGIFSDCLENQYLAILYVCNKKILAYSVSQFIVDECHLLNLCVSQEARGQGLATKMIKYLINQARQSDTGSIFLEVRVSNESAIHLYDKLGFNEVGMRRDYYPDINGREDALVLAYEIF